jgi:hypothetical protein
MRHKQLEKKKYIPTLQRFKVSGIEEKAMNENTIILLRFYGPSKSKQNETKGQIYSN